MKYFLLKKYVRETALHGFLYTDTNNKLNLLFWATLIVTCACFCINDICALVQKYILVPTVLSLSVTQNLHAILPTPTLCMETMVPAPVSDGFVVDDINNDIKAFMSATGNATNLNVISTQMQLTGRLEYLTYMMLGYITDFELFYTGDKKPMYTDYATNYPTDSRVSLGDSGFYFKTAFATSYQIFMQPVYEAYMSYNVSLNNLKRLVGMSLCHKQIRMARYGTLLRNTSGMPIASICTADTVSHLSFALLCIKLFNTTNFAVTDGLTVSLLGLISASANPFPPFLRTRKIQDNLTTAYYVPVDFIWYVDLQGRPVVPAPPLTDIFSFDPALPSNKYHISVAAEYDFYSIPSIPTRTCQRDVRERDCIQQKKAEIVSKSCNCWLSTLLGVVNISNMPTCSDNPAVLNWNVLSDVTYRQCRPIGNDDVTSLCNQDCKSYLFNIGVVDAAPTVDLDEWYTDAVKLTNLTKLGSAEITFQSQSLRSYIVESPAMPFTVFACTFGGIIGTYLGGSLLALVHIPVFFVAQLTSLLFQRKKVESSEKADKKVDSMNTEGIYPPVAAEANVVSI